jgi:hypothetical protein
MENSNTIQALHCRERMRQQRLSSIAIDKKTKQGKATAKKLKRLDKRVR